MAKNLDRYESQIEESLDRYVPVSDEERKRILSKATKSRTVSLRLNETVLDVIKRKAGAEGLSCQTLIFSVLCKYSTDRLVDEDKIRKAIELVTRK